MPWPRSEAQLDYGDSYEDDGYLTDNDSANDSDNGSLTEEDSAMNNDFEGDSVREGDSSTNGELEVDFLFSCPFVIDEETWKWLAITISFKKRSYQISPSINPIVSIIETDGWINNVKAKVLMMWAVRPVAPIMERHLYRTPEVKEIFPQSVLAEIHQATRAHGNEMGKSTYIGLRVRSMRNPGKWPCKHCVIGMSLPTSGIMSMIKL